MVTEVVTAARGDETSPLVASSPPRFVCRGIRGATTAATNTAEDILEATDELMRVVIHLNELEPDDVVSAIFTTTPDLTATFPALAARNIGWTEVPLICSHEMNVPGSLQRAVRVLLHVNTTKSPQEIRHVYLKGAQQLRPEWAYSDERVAAILAEAYRHMPTR
jgi:chorismate mutase